MFQQAKYLAAPAAASTRVSSRPADAAIASRSLYVSRLRKAFLLRVHPDRFRSQPDIVRKEQASLVQALSDRFSDPDFLAFTTPTR